MLNFISTFGVDSQFERNRLLLTNANLQAPNEQQMKNILMTFSGQDQETRAQIAYASIMRKMHSSTSRDYWLYILKNLLILDRVISDNRFCYQIVETDLHPVQNFKSMDSKANEVGARNLLKNYWILIKTISANKISKKRILHCKRSERRQFLESLKGFEIFQQIKNIQNLFDQCLQLIYHVSGINNINQRENQRRTQVVADVQKKGKFYKQFTNSHLAEYMTLHFYSKLLTFFSCQYLCIHQHIQTLISHTKNEENITIQDVKQFKKSVHKFKINCNDMVLLAERNKNHKGFEHIDIKQFYAFQEQGILKFIDQFISQHNSIFEQKKRNVQPLVLHRQANQKYLHVQNKPVSQSRKGCFHKSPRKTIELSRNNKGEKRQTDPFLLHFNRYSSQFPHSDMMTLDLIQDLRSDPNMEEQSFNLFINDSDKQREADFFSEFKKLKSNSTWKDILLVNEDFMQLKPKQQVLEPKREHFQGLFGLLLNKSN